MPPKILTNRFAYVLLNYILLILKCVLSSLATLPILMAASDSSCPETKLSIKPKEGKTTSALLQRAQWLRAAILGANDGLLSTTSLMLGVGAAKEDQRLMIVSGLAGALAGACSMAVGEFVSVSTQRDIEQKTRENPSSEKNDGVSTVKISEESSTGMKENLNDIVEGSKEKCSSYNVSFSPPLMKVIARSDGGMDNMPNPYKAAGASGAAFLCGSAVPILSGIVFCEENVRVIGIVAMTSVALAMFGAAGARIGGSPVTVSAVRVLIGGWISMAVTYGLLKPLDRDDKARAHSDH